MKPIRFGYVGSGWRAEFFWRITHALPERFAVAGVVSRRAERRRGGALVCKGRHCKRFILNTSLSVKFTVNSISTG